jgi:glycine/sarcosine N-methyltransferase
MIEATTAAQEIAGFYDGFAPDYDTMTRFEDRFIKERPYYHLLVKKYNISTALDAGCGTGFHSLLLSRLGVTVTGSDISGEMLKRANQHARDFQQQVRFVKSDFENLSAELSETFGAIFCLGNSLPHTGNETNLRSTLNNFYNLLEGDGLLFLQLLNYDRILNERERVQNVRETNGKTFIRFYDYGEDSLTFNLMILERHGSAIHHKLSSVPIYPLRPQNLVTILSEEHFTDIELFGSAALLPFDPQTSQDLFILARKES